MSSTTYYITEIYKEKELIEIEYFKEIHDAIVYGFDKIDNLDNNVTHFVVLDKYNIIRFRGGNSNENKN